MKTKTIFNSLVETVLVLTLTSCAGARPEKEPVRAALWVDALQGEPLPFEEMMGDLRQARVVYLGEYHSIERHHQLEELVFRALAQRGLPLVLAMEQFEFFCQPALDQFNRGEIGLPELIQQTSWAKRWPGYTNYVPLLAFAARHKVPVLALNAREETIRAVGRSGLAGLKPEQRQELPEQIVTDDPLYRKLLNRVLGVHMAFDPGKLKPIIEAQISRDETMASRLAAFLASTAGTNRTAVVICGRGHCEYGFGMPARVARRLPGVTQRIVLFSESGDLQLTPQERKEARDVEVSHQFLRDLGRFPGDYFHIIEPSRQPKD